MRLKIVEKFEHRVTLAADAQQTLFSLLKSQGFCQQICQQVGCDRVEFTELVFQPMPYTLQEPKGMPAEYERYHASPDYVIVNVPPNFMFQAKIAQPSRLCAIYRKDFSERSNER